MARLPNFNASGVLPPGDYVLTFAQLQDSMLVKGSKTGARNWDTQWRGFLASNLRSVANTLWELGVEYLVIDGSFVEQKDRPNDIDAYFPISRESWVSRKVELGLNRKRSEQVWTWDPDNRYKSKDPRAPHPKLPFWHKYRIDLWPDFGQGAIDHEHLGLLTFEKAFRRTRGGDPKGVVKIFRSS
jgi:hypothetical protein